MHMLAVRIPQATPPGYPNVFPYIPQSLAHSLIAFKVTLKVSRLGTSSIIHLVTQTPLRDMMD